jgi:mRNA degradation ribonuclease J1/J2
MIEMISPATIYPIHTEHPEMFEKIATNEVETIEIGRECKI